MSSSLAPECSERKERYDTCFINWYSEQYLRGNTTESDDCKKLFEEYKTCLNKALKEKGIYEMIEDARRENTTGIGGGGGGGGGGGKSR